MAAASLAFRRVAVGRPSSASDTCPASRLRSDTRRRLRSVHQMQTTAASMPPAAPASSDVADTWSESAVVPTASTHHVPRPVMISHA